ncbi:MAG TPA: hypothetical protein VLI54_04160 [Bacillota bacterium]|nr:hypothetical protein [Bacillota bacterium]
MTLRKYIDTYEWSGLGFAAGVAVIIAAAMLAPHFFSASHSPAAATRKPAVLAEATKPTAPATPTPAAVPQAAPAPAPTPAPEPLSRTVQVTEGKYAGWNLYTSKRYGIAFNYPASWDLQEIETASPTDPEATQLTLNLSITAEGKTIQLITLTAHNAPLASLESIHDDLLNQHPDQFSKQTRINDYGRETAIYGQLDADSLAWSELYLISNGEKTYGVHNKNALHYGDPGSDTYLSDFERLYESIVL